MIAPASLPQLNLPQAAARPDLERTAGADRDVERAEGLKAAFTQFVGETFFGQMLKAMRTTVGEPAYFHGGSAERQFQARLDQQLAQDLASSGSGGFANGLFESQFPTEAQTLRDAAQVQREGAQVHRDGASSLAGLDGLRRR